MPKAHGPSHEDLGANVGVVLALLLKPSVSISSQSLWTHSPQWRTSGEHCVLHGHKQGMIPYRRCPPLNLIDLFLSMCLRCTLLLRWYDRINRTFQGRNVVVVGLCWILASAFVLERNGRSTTIRSVSSTTFIAPFKTRSWWEYSIHTALM